MAKKVTKKTVKKQIKKATKNTAKKVVKKVTKKIVVKVKKIAPELKVKDIKFSPLLTVNQDMTIMNVAKLMTANKIGAVVIMSPIFDAVGIFTERDLLNRVVSAGIDLNQEVVEVMTLSFKCAQIEDEIKSLAEMMIRSDIRHLPVMDGKKIIGMLSIRDILKTMATIRL